MFRIIIVEDEDIIRKGLLFTIPWEKYNCTVVAEAADGEEGLQKIERLRPDIVISDIKMPLLDGLSMIEQAKKFCNFESILLTGFEEFKYAQKAIGLGVFQYILKPVETVVLEQTLAQVTAKIALHQETMDSAATLQNLEQLLLCNTNLPSVTSVPKTIDNRVQSCLEYIKQNYTEKISLSDLGNLLFVSVPHLNALFKEATGYPFIDYLNRYRIAKSLALLSEIDSRVSEVALAVGFSDYKYFIRVFKKYLGDSPHAFIAKRKK